MNQRDNQAVGAAWLKLTRLSNLVSPYLAKLMTRLLELILDAIIVPWIYRSLQGKTI